MNTTLVLRGLLVGVLSLVIAAVLFSRYDAEIGSEATEGRQRYRPVINCGLLPLFLLVITVRGLQVLGPAPTFKMMLGMCFDIFLHISLYYAILIPALPFLRKHISARACALLWLLPNYLYLTQQSYLKNPRPLVILHTSSRVVWVLFALWLLGFAVVFVGSIVHHLLFRRQILKNAVPVTDPAVLELFRDEIAEAAIEKPIFRVAVSPDVSTPLSIGLFRRSTRILLPERDYSPDELRLIFRHELIHIGREDSWTKFFLMFCTAMCWFNPLMWMAMKKSAEDVELSCDETVLLDADETARTQYANLILRTAGDDRGFTTCLSASASSMRYRLKSIVKPAKRRTGALTAGLTFFVLCMTCGYVSLAYGEDTGATTIFRDRELSQFTADKVTVTGGEYEVGRDQIDADALTQYLADLPTQEMTGNYSYDVEERSLSVWYNSPDGIMLVELHTSFLEVLYLRTSQSRQIYHLPEPADWAYLDTIAPPLPEANVKLSCGTPSPYYGHHLTATVTSLARRTGETTEVIRDQELQPDEGAGIYGTIRYTDAAVTFSMPLTSDVTVTIESWDYGSSRTMTFSQQEEVSFQLPAYPAHYTLTASFQGSDGTYDTVFVFHIGEV